MVDPAKLNEVYGDVVKLVTPTGFEVTLRQQNGDDDDVISNGVMSQDGTSINKFVSGIVVDTNYTTSRKLSLDDVLSMKLCDKFFIILASRIYSLGNILRFSFHWDNMTAPIEYEEDLSQYIWDYSKDYFPSDLRDPDYYKYRIAPHKFGGDKVREFTTRTGKKLMYTFMNGYGEKYLLKLNPEAQSKNQELLARDLKLWVDGKWIKVENFRNFTPYDMADIRREINENDKVTELITELQNPVTGEIMPYLIVGTPDFFFPREI
jgi:hypothetical protein